MPRRSDSMAVGPHRVRGLFVASLAAWTSFMLIATAVPLIYIAGKSLVSGNPPLWPSSRELFGGFESAAVIGFPISLIVCFAVGYPIWRFASARGLTRGRNAVKIGALAGIAFFLVLTTAAQISIYVSNSTYSFSRGGITLTENNLPTVEGLLFELVLVPLYAAVGAVAGFAAWWAGRTPQAHMSEASQPHLK